MRVGVVERRAHNLGLDEHRAQRLQGEDLASHPQASGALEHDVELRRRPMAMAGRGLARVKAPQTSSESLGTELSCEVGVQHAHLVRRPPVGLRGMKYAIAGWWPYAEPLSAQGARA